MSQKSVLFICFGNACRSAMAEAITNHLYVGNLFAESAGVYLQADFVEMDDPTVEVMSEIGIDISNHKPRNIRHCRDKSFDVVINMSPVPTEKLSSTSGISSKTWLTWDIDDPRNKDVGVYRSVRDEIRRLLAQFTSP